MKNKIAIASAFIAASSFSTAEIVVNDFLSFEGFVDMSYTHTDIDADAASLDGSDNSFQIDQVEISWLFDFDPVTAQIDLQYEDIANSGDVDFDDEVYSEGNVVEQAFVTYHFDNGGALTAGRYASMLGFEAFEPTGLYQYSFAYDLMVGDVSVLPGYAQGIKYTQESDSSFFGISLQDEAFDLDGDRLGGSGDSSFAVEVAGAFYMDNGLSWFIGGVYEDGDADDSDSYVINTYVTFETGAWIFAAEASYGDFDGGAALSGLANLVADEDFGADFFGENEEAMQFLLMANFAYSDVASITGRLSYIDHTADASADSDIGGDVSLDAFKATLAHGYAFTDNLFLVTEVSYVDGDYDVSDFSDADGSIEGLQAAVELLFSF